MPAAGQRCRQSGADPGGQDSGALGRVVTSKCQNNSAQRLLLPYLAALVSLAEQGTAATASLVPGSGLGTGSARSLFFWEAFLAIRSSACQGQAGCGWVSLTVCRGLAVVAGAIWDALVSSGMAASPQLRGPCSPASPDAFSMGAMAARDMCRNPLDEVLMASGACSSCSLPMGGKDMGGPSPPRHRTVLVPPHRGLERPRAALGMPGAKGTLTSAGAKLRGCISRYLGTISRLLPS